MSAAEVMAPVDAAPAEEVPVAMEATIDPVAVAADEEDEEELVFKARGKRTRHQADAKGGGPDAEDDISPRGPIDASQADSPPKSSDDELDDDDDAKLPGKKKLKLRKKSAAAAENAAFGYTEGDSELDEDDAPEAAAEEEGDFYYDEDDEEGQLEMRMREKGTLSEEEEEEEPPAEEESEESDLEDSEDELDLDDAPRPAPAAPVAPAPVPENETEEEKEARMAREKAETAAAQQEIMREASRRARLTGYHVAPDRDPFAYRKIFATLATIVEKLNLPPPPPDPVEEEEPNPFDGEDASEDDVEEEEAEYDSQEEDEEEEEDEREAAAATVELEIDPEDEEGLDDQEDLGLENDEIAAMMAAVEAKKAAVAAAADAKELRAQKKKEAKVAAEEAAAAEEEEEEDDLSEEETHEMTRKERLRQLKKAKAFFKADAAAQKKAGAGEAFEDEAEMSEDGGHTSDEEEVEVEEAGENADRVIKRRVAKRADGLLDREELEEMVDYIDFNDTADDDERRMAKRAAAHARFEEERDEEEVRKMREALKNGFRRPNKNGLMGEDGPDYWQRRRKNGGEDESDEEDDLGIDIPDRAWEAVVLSSDDDGEWAERAARRKAAAAAEAAKKASAESAPDGFGEDSQVPSARDVGFASQDFKSMIDAGKQRRRRVQRGIAAAAAAADAGVGFAAPAAPLPRTNSGPSMPATGGSRLNPVVGPRGLERQASTSFLGRAAANGSKSSGGLVRSVSLGGGGASRSFVFGAGGDSQSMWEKDAEENGRETPPTVLKELGADDNARVDFGWAPRDKFPAAKQAPSRLGGAAAGGSGQSLFGMLQASQDWDEVIGRSDSLAEGVKAAKNIKLRPAAPR